MRRSGVGFGSAARWRLGMDGGHRHSHCRRLQEPNFNGGAPESAPGQNRASSWHSMRHLADIGIYAIMLAHLTQCVLSMLSICRCVYAHMTITHILQLVLPLPAARPAAP